MPDRFFADDFRLNWSPEETTLDSAESLLGGGRLHGGAIAAFGLLSARGRCDPHAAPPPSAAICHVNYMRAGRGQSFKARVSSGRKVKELTFHDLVIRDESDEAIASAQIALTMARADVGPASSWITPAGDGSFKITGSGPIGGVRARNNGTGRGAPDDQESASPRTFAGHH